MDHVDFFKLLDLIKLLEGTELLGSETFDIKPIDGATTIYFMLVSDKMKMKNII